MDRKELAMLIDAYADAKLSRNEYLCRAMIEKLEEALTYLYEGRQQGE